MHKTAELTTNNASSAYYQSWTIRVFGHRHTRSVAKRKSGNQFIVIITDWYSKLIKAIWTAQITATAVATIFVDNWIPKFGILETVLTENDPQFTSKVFQAVCAKLRTRPLTTTKYHPQTNE